MGDQTEARVNGGRSNGALVLLIGAAALIVGALLPWATASAGFISISKAGTDGDGVITLILGAVIALFALFAWKPEPHQWAVIVGVGAGLAAAGVAIYDIVNVSDAVNTAESRSSLVHASVGAGLWVTAIGAAATIVGGLVKNSEGQAQKADRVKASASVLTPAPAGTAEGWMPDPSGRHPDRWWDGKRWTEWVRDKPGGTRSDDPPVPSQ